MFHNTKNHFSMLIKNYSMINLIKYGAILFLFDIIRTILLIKDNYFHSIANIKAYFWVLKKFPKLWQKRVVIQKRLRKVSDEYIKNKMLNLNLIRLMKNYKILYPQSVD